MIKELKDFTVVRGQNSTSAAYFGDLERIEFPKPLVAYRKSLLPFGIDLAWLQECACQREWLLGRSVEKLSTFSKAVCLAAPVMPEIYNALSSWLEKDCFTYTNDIGTVIPDPLMLSDDLYPRLQDHLSSEGYVITSADLPLSVPPCNAFPSSARMYALERAVPQFQFACIELPQLQGNVTAETSSHTGQPSAAVTPTLVGSRRVYIEEVVAYKQEGVWSNEVTETRKARFGVTGGFTQSFPRQRFSNTLIPASQDLWVLAYVQYSNSRSQQDDELRWIFVKVETAKFGISKVDQTSVDAVIAAVQRSFEFDMDPASFPDHGLRVQEYALYYIYIYRCWSVVTFKDTVTMTQL